MKKKVFISLFLFILTLAFVACSNENENVSKDSSNGGDAEQEITSGGTLRVAYGAEPAALDPAMNTDEPTANVSRHIYETLVVRDSKDNIRPLLAESWEESEDYKSVIFKLRQGIKFHNDKEMLAEDVEASMKRWIERSTIGSDFEEATVEIIDDYTVKISYPEPMPGAMSVFSHQGGEFMAIMPKDIVENDGGATVNEYIGTGPFKYEDWNQGQFIHFKKNEDYVPVDEEADGLAGKREAFVDDLYIDFSSDPMTQLSGLKTGEYDIVYRLPHEMVEQVENDSNLDFITRETGQYNLFFNKATGVFTSNEARQAALLAMDHQTILEAAYLDEQFYGLDHNIMDTNEQWYSEVGKAENDRVDLDEAKRLLEESGYNGEEVVFVVRANLDEHRKGSLVIQQQLESIGMNVKMETLDGTTVGELLYDESAYDLVIQTQYPKSDPASLLFLNEEYVGWTDNTGARDTIEKLKHGSSPEESQEAYEELQEWFYDYLPMIRVGDFNNVVAYSDKVQNLNYYGQPYFWNVGIEE